jgi:hypothetical protein
VTGYQHSARCEIPIAHQLAARQPAGTMKTIIMTGIAGALVMFAARDVAAQDANGADASAALAKKLQNPVASLISVPVQGNYDTGIGPDDAARYTLNIQPVIPVSIGARMNLIIRTIVPLVDADAPVPGGEDLSGLGDITQSFFFSPNEPIGGWVVGAGPVLLYPSASEDQLGAEKWAAGPTFVVLRQQKGWTYGALGNHLWSFAGDDARSDVEATFLQPFVSFTTPKFTTYGLNTESSYDWQTSQWVVPINASVSQLLKFGKQPVSIAIGARYYAERPDGAAEWGARLVFTMLFPK